MSTEHFSIHQGVFIFIRFDVNNRRSFCFGSFLFQIINDLPNHGRHFLLCCKNSFLPYFPDSHGKFLPALVSFDVQYKNFSGIVFKDHCTGISADAEMKISREMIQWFLKKTVSTGFAAFAHFTFQNLVCAGQWSVDDKKSPEFHPYVLIRTNCRSPFVGRINKKLLILYFVHAHLKSLFSQWQGSHAAFGRS